MSHHARPHLQTHNRAQGHSAVAGAAYRLGLRLYDQRAKKWQDFRRRKLGEEIVRAVTVAPEGAPAWAVDPGELFNKAEAAENRKDSQVARDYRIPIPFGFTDEQAGDLAEGMAEFIAKELSTAVSMGLHRDADVDALGAVKPAGKQGFHAHLYFPTRKLEELAQGDGSSSWGLGAKLILLSNKRTSSLFVEQLNREWAERSNLISAANNLTADYDHRSYSRQDIGAIPQPTLGRAVTALERKGVPTRKGDVLRASIIIPADALSVAHEIVLDTQEAPPPGPPLGGAQEAQLAVPTLPSAAQLLRGPGPIVFKRPSQPAAISDQSLTARFEVVFLGSPSAADGPPMRIVRIVRAIERALTSLLLLAFRLTEHRQKRKQRVSDKLALLLELDRARARRSAARDRARQWEAEHPLRIVGAKVLGGASGPKPSGLQALIDIAQTHDEHAQAFKGSLRDVQASLDVFDAQEQGLVAEQVETEGTLKAALDGLMKACPSSIPSLLSVASAEEGALLKSMLPEASLSSEASVEAPKDPKLVARPTSPRI